jgi:hypothetical protein
MTMRILCADYATPLYPQKLALASPTTAKLGGSSSLAHSGHGVIIPTSNTAFLGSSDNIHSVKKFTAFGKPKGSLPCSLEPASGLYSEPNTPITNLLTPFLQDQFE